jgi:hypothetical protein
MKAREHIASEPPEVIAIDELPRPLLDLATLR